MPYLSVQLTLMHEGTAQAEVVKDGVAPDPERFEASVETGLEYRPGHPVRVRVVRRGRRTEVSDAGAAFDTAGRPHGWEEAARQVERQLTVNFSRAGAISLPVVPVGPPEGEVVRRIGEASRAFYQELLELPETLGTTG